MMDRLYFCSWCFYFFVIIEYGSSDCSVSIPTYNVTSSTGNTLNGIQLLFPSWSFSCTGTIDKWMAHVTGDTSIHSSIEFQIFQPDSVKDNVYHIVYGNSYRGEVVDNTTISVTVDNVNTPRLPIRPDYIVGIYISSNVLNLLYDSTGDVDIYYWENTQQQCDLSLCNAQIIRGVNPLVGWTFRNITSVNGLEDTLAVIKQLNPNYCNDTNILSCVQPTTSSILSSMSTTLAVNSSRSNTLTTTTISKLFTTLDIISTHTKHSINMSTTIPSSQLATTESIVTTSSFVVPSVTTTPYMETNEMTQLQLILVISVVVLLVFSILLTSILIVLLLIKVSKRIRMRKLQSSSDPPKQNHHVSTGVNPSYHLRTILPSDVVEDVDSNKLYSEIDEDYCQPEPNIYIKSHTYDNTKSFTSGNHTYSNTNHDYYKDGELYEDMNTL